MFIIWLFITLTYVKVILNNLLAVYPPILAQIHSITSASDFGNRLFFKKKIL